MADYQAQIRLGVQGLNQLGQLERRLENAVELLGRLEQGSANVGQASQSAQRNLERARQRMFRAGFERTRANRTVENVSLQRDIETGRFAPGGGTLAARRLAGARLRLAERETREAARNLREQERNRRLVAAAERRYARALDRAGNAIGGIQGGVQEQQVRVGQVMQRIGQGSRGNYLTNLFQGRQLEFARGGAGDKLPAALQQQAQSVREAWDLATAGGRENLQLMQRLTTEMAGLVKQQNELNRSRAGRSIAFESGRRGQERITALSAMPGADPARIRRLRSLATDTISTGYIGDIPGSRLAQRRMNAAIGRYERELNAAAEQLRASQRIAGRRLNARTSWQNALSEMGVIAEQNRRALPDKNLLAERVARSGGTAPVRLDELQAQAKKREAEEAKRAAGSVGRFAAALEREEKRLASLGIGAPSRVGKAIPLGGAGGSAGMFNQYPFPAGPGNIYGAATFKAQKELASQTQKIEAQVASNIADLDEKRFQDKLAQYKQLAAEELRLSKASDAELLRDFDRRLKGRIEAKKQAESSRLMQGSLRQAVGEGLIGGAFPLLFGQGLGASAGGLAGGFGGGLMGGSFGFGLSLIGTAVGGAIDTTANNLKELAGSLKSPNDAMTALEKSGFNVSDSLKFQVKALQDVGRAYDAQSLVLQEVEKRLGAGSVKELNALSSEQKKLQESWAILSGDLQRTVIPAVIGFTIVLNDLVNFINSIRGGREGIDTSKRNYRFNPFTGRLTDIGARERSQGRVEKAIAAASSRVALNPQEAYDAESKRIDLSRKAADDIRSAYREAFNLQRRAHDLQRDGADINREIADYGYKKEREIFELRQQAAEKQIENIRGAAQNRIESSDLSARQTFAAAVGFEQQLLSNVREAMRARMEGESDIEQSRRRLELAMARLNRDSEDYKRTNAREIEDIERRKLSYVRSVEDYKIQVADYVLQRSREAADYQRQAALTAGIPVGAPGAGGAGATGGGVGGGSVGGIGNMLPGTRGGPNINEGVGYGRGRLHAGRDLGLDVGDPIHARRGGVVTQSYSSGFGRVGGAVVIKYDDGMQGVYGHTLPGVGAGQRVLAGQHIATVAPDAANTHLHYELRDQAGKLLEPLKFILESLKVPAGKINAQAQASTQLSNIPAPVFKPTPIGPTPSAAPSNAANMAARSMLGLSERDAQRIYEAQINLRQKGIELGQIEQILQNNQLPQLQQQHEALKRQVEARRQILGLSDQGASLIDAEAESEARIAQIEKDRANAIAGVQKQYGNNAAALAQVNTQADLALRIAKEEEKQRLENIELNNRLQGMDRARTTILQMQEELAMAKVQAAALENGQLEANTVELMRASTAYREAEETQRRMMDGLKFETEELRKQSEFRRQMVELQRDTGLVGAGLRAGLIGASGRAYEQGLRDFNGDTSRASELAKQSQLLENQRLVWDNLEKSIVGVSDAISGALTNGLVDIANGSKKIEDVGRDMLNNIARSFADAAQQQLTALLQRQLAGVLGGLLGGGGTGAGVGGALLGSFAGNAPSLIPGFAPSFTFGGFLAEGGNAKRGEAYVVGEKEPEFFFPGVNGRVVPKSEMEKIDGLRRMNSKHQKLDIGYTVTEHAGVRYVTEEQFRKAQPAIAQRAQAMTYAGMRNSRDVRDYVGVD